MPSGYTAGVADGEVTEFREYALRCARNFGALVMMRDEPFDAEIPEKLEPSTYHAENLEKCRQELMDLECATEEEIQAMVDADYEKLCAICSEALERKRTERQRYESMLEKARAYVPPTEDHKEYAEFLVKQLEESIKWDCDTTYYEDETKRFDRATWKERKMQKLRENISHHTKGQREENERTEKRNRWVADLRKSLETVG